MEPHIIDMDRIRKALPKHAIVILRKKESVIFLECFVRWPFLSENDFEMCKQWQREIIGQEYISEFYTETIGTYWLVYLKRVPLEFINTTDTDINTYTGLHISELIKNTL